MLLFIIFFDHEKNEEIKSSHHHKQLHAPKPQMQVQTQKFKEKQVVLRMLKKCLNCAAKEHDPTAFKTSKETNQYVIVNIEKKSASLK